MQQLTEGPTVATILIDRRIANRDCTISLHPGWITEHLGKFTVRLVLATAGQPGGRQAFRRDAELDVLYRRAERAKEDGFIVRAILGIPFLGGGLGEAGLRARIAKDEDDRDRVGPNRSS
jgi:hypothetical protein